MTQAELEKRLFDALNEALEEKELSLSAILGTIYALYETIRGVFNYQTFSEVKKVNKQHQPD